MISFIGHIQFCESNTKPQPSPSVGTAVVALDNHEALLGQALGSKIRRHWPVVLHTLYVGPTVDL